MADLATQVRAYGKQAVQMYGRDRLVRFLTAYGFDVGPGFTEKLNKEQLTVLKYVLMDYLEGAEGRTPIPPPATPKAKGPRYLLLLR